MALLDGIVSRISSNLGGAKTQSLLQTVITQAGGLQGLAGRFNTSGMAEVFNSWVGTGENGAIKPEQIEAVLGNQIVQQIAQKLGIDTNQARQALAQLLPQAVDQLTPAGAIEAEAAGPGTGKGG
ncbi:MAG: YidB family protein [Cyanobacteriota bacterium]